MNLLVLSLSLWLGTLSPVASFTVTTTITPYSFRSLSLSVLRDEYLQPHYTEPSTPRQHDVERMVECASSEGLCDVDEMAEMIAEIEHANHGDSPTKERDEVLKQALTLQMELTETRLALQHLGLEKSGTDSVQARSSFASFDESALEDHSFDHFVDYRSIGEFESH